jgi:mono/diheme cytochrome c family protein
MCRAAVQAAGRFCFFGLLLVLVACEPPGRPQFEAERAETTDFAILFTLNCAGCHGVEGKNGPGRILNDPLYLAVIPRETLKQVVIHGRPGTAMPPWEKSEGGPLTMRQIDALVDGIEKNWAKPAQFSNAQMPPYTADQQGNSDSGRKLFLRNCFMCHGPGAKIGPVADPTYLSLVSNQMLRTSIIVGRPDLGMPDYRNLKLGKPLANHDIADLVAFLASKRPASTGTAQSSAIRQNSTADSYRTKTGNKSTGASSQQGIK